MLVSAENARPDLQKLIATASSYMVIHEQVQNCKHHQAEEKYLSTQSPTLHQQQSPGFRAAVPKGVGGFEEATWSWRLGG